MKKGLTGLPHGAVLALLGWLVLSQGLGPSQIEPPATAALIEGPTTACERLPNAPLPVVVLESEPPVLAPEALKFEMDCLAELER